MSGTSTTIHNAQIQLLTTLVNNAALGFIGAARLHRRRLHRAGGEWPAELVRADLGRLRRRPTLRGAPDTQEASMSWDQLWVWVIWPVIVALILGVGGLWSARRIP
jgi:hypothetical protein